MYKLFLLATLWVSFSFSNCTHDPTSFAIKASYNAESVQAIENDTILLNIQNKIYNNFIQSLMTKQQTALVKTEDQLARLYAEKKIPIVQYWRAYNNYYAAIYYLKMEDKEKSQALLEKGIELLQSFKNKNSEDYALMALLQSFSTQFASGMEAGTISGLVKLNSKKAMELDPKNVRAYYVAGSNNFYTPEKYGGGKEVEKLLIQAIQLPAQKVKNPYLPSWGRDDAYELLVRHLIKVNKKEEARKHFKDGIAQYPDHYMLNQIAKELL